MTFRQQVRSHTGPSSPPSQHITFGDLLHIVVAALLSLQLAVPALSQDADAFARAECAHGVACAPHYVALNASTDAVAVFTPTRLLAGGALQVARGTGAGAGGSAGVDPLFSARSALLLARAAIAGAEHHAIVRSLHAAAQGFLAAPSRAPPLS